MFYIILYLPFLIFFNQATKNVQWDWWMITVKKKNKDRLI